MSPQRIQRSRAKGWRMPEGAIYVGRPTRWGNPWSIEEHANRSDLFNHGVFVGQSTDPEWARRRGIELYSDWLAGTGHVVAEEARRCLAGSDLVCWCRLDQPCHADVLLELANGGVL